MTHSQCQEMLPWYETLDAAHRRELDAHVGNCPECGRELDEIHALRKTMTPLEDIPEPSAFMLSRTIARIDAYEHDKSAARPMGWRRITVWWSESAPPLRVLIAAQAALIILLGIGLAHFRSRAEVFSTLAGPVATAPGWRLTVAFQPGASEEALRQAVREVNGTIVGGPSALGIYIVQIPRDSDVSQVSAILRANSTVVRLAEKLPDQ